MLRPVKASTTRFGPWYLVALMATLFIVSYVDRLILTLLVEPIKAEVGLTDVRMGLLIGPAFAILYSIVGIPIAWLVDRANRTRLLVLGVMIWSTSTVLAGFASTFETLFGLRMCLAIGEAVLSPVALSLIGDLFPQGRRSAPSSVFIASGTAGVMLSYIVGGGIIDLASSGELRGLPAVGDLATWRLSLVLVGIPGLLIALVAAATMREPSRGGLDAPQVAAGGQGTSFGIFRTRSQALRHYSAFFIGNAFLGMMLYGALAWYPTYLIRTQGVTASQAGYIFSSAMVIGVVLTLVFPILAERIARNGRRDLLLFIPLIVIPPGAFLFVLAMLQTSLVAASVLMAGGFSLLSSITAIASIAIPQTAPPDMRGRLVAVVQLCNNIAGLGLGTYLVSLLAQSVFEGPAAIGTALMAIAVVTAPIAWLLFLLAWLPYRHAVYAAREVG